MNKRTQKTVIITGGAQGIGKGIAQNFLKNGFAVVIADIDEEAGGECADEYRKLGDVRFVKTDVSDEASVKGCIKKTIKWFDEIQVLINNTGIGTAFGCSVEKLELKDWEKVVATNLTGMFLMTKHAVPYLRKSIGSIVNVASTRALQSEANTEAYSASKGGVVALTHALSISLGPSIRVNCIRPGWIEVGDWKKSKVKIVPHHSEADKKQHPAGRVGIPYDIAEMALFLCSEKAGFITGQNFVIDGGMTKKMMYV
jgi:NAD(P)-dependent dehydrogenase (short-subunit alcohol dehydrogenase family)